MPRHPRIAPGDMIYHVLNRGNCRLKIFTKDGDYLAFLKLLEEGRQRTRMRILAYCLMPNHWHLVLWPRNDGDLARFVGWISTTHVRRWRAHRGTDGEGHLCQGRYKSFIVADDKHLLTVLRYVEQNALRAALVQRAEDWPWGSAATPITSIPTTRPIVDAWPIDRPADWAERLNQDLPGTVLERLRLSGQRGRPYGDEGWTERIVKRLGLEHTVRDPWRPRKNLLASGVWNKPALGLYNIVPERAGLRLTTLRGLWRYNVKL
jgi:putative transposase